MAEFQRTAPKVALNLHDLTGNAICDGLRSGNLELGITPLPSEMNLHGLMFELLKAYSLVVALPQGHPLAKSRIVPVKRLLDYPLVTYSKRDYMDYHEMLAALFEPHGGTPRATLEVDRATTLIAAVASGRGIALVTELFGRTSGSRLKLRPLAGSETAVKICILTAKDADVTPAGVEFCKVLRKIANS